MPETALRPCAYHVIRYTPNLVRDEWVNIGILLFDPASGRVLRRWMEEPAEFARVRRLHPAADEALLRGLPEELDAQLAGNNGQAAEQLARLEQTLSNAVQISPRKGLLAEDFDAELDRLYRDHVEPPRYGRAFEDLSTRNAIRTRANQVFRSAGIGTRGYLQALPLGRDPGQAKVLAFTAEAIRAKAPKTDFLAVTEIEPRPQDNPRHRFVTGLLEERGVAVVPLTRLMEWAQKMRPALLGTNGN